MSKKDKYYVLATVIIVTALCCYTLHNFRLFAQYSDEMTNVFRQAGSNRRELIKVLKHYSRNPADSLKLRAAEFLIVNMPGKYSEYYDAPWEDVAAAHVRWTSSRNSRGIVRTYQLGQPVIREDLKHITGAYLINNIELAFKVWEEMPWGKDISFEIFCEEILPYRFATEAIDNWREKVLASFAELYSSFQEGDISIIDACRMVNDRLPRFRHDTDFPPMNFSQLMTTARGTCDEMSALTIFAMRGLGIPVSGDYTPLWIARRVGHSWNSVRDSCGVKISFMGAESNPGENHMGITEQTSKVYRHAYANQQNVVTVPENIPPLLQKVNYIIDVTSEYGTSADIHAAIINGEFNLTGYAFLAMPFEMQWNAIGWGKIVNDKIHFQSAGTNLFYLAVYYNDGVQTSASYPFRLDEKGDCHFFIPGAMQTVQISNVAIASDRWLYRMQGGIFEVANRSDFSDAQTLHRIATIPEARFHDVITGNRSKYRYIRYVSPPSGHCNVSILEFYDENNEKITGTAIGTPGAWNNSSMTHEKVFDGDVDTFFDAVSHPAWTGLDMGEPKTISKIRYLPRTYEGDGIYEGHVYELFYWNNDNWQSLGRQTANSHVLEYDVPENALLIIKNITKNRTLRPFIMKKGKESWR